MVCSKDALFNKFMPSFSSLSLIVFPNKAKRTMVCNIIIIPKT